MAGQSSETQAAMVEHTKTCNKCGAVKALHLFPTRDGTPYGRICRACICEAQNLRRAQRLGLEDKHSLTQRNKTLSQEGKRECRVCGDVKLLAEYRVKGGAPSLRCLACTNAQLREAYAANANGIRDRLIEHGKKRRQKHGQRLNDQKRAYVANNRAKVTQRQNEWAKVKLRADPVFAVKKRIRSLISNAFASVGSQKNMETQAILGCTFKQFMAHIERQFTPGMSWDRMGPEIHIDHIRPLATAKSEADVVALNHFTNLRPMWADENIAKGSKVVALL